MHSAPTVGRGHERDVQCSNSKDELQEQEDRGREPQRELNTDSSGQVIALGES